jgi:hypothetical protein
MNRSAKKNTHGPPPRTKNVFTIFRGSHNLNLRKEVAMPTAAKKPAAKKAAKPATKKAAMKKPAAKAKKKAPAKKPAAKKK